MAAMVAVRQSQRMAAMVAVPAVATHGCHGCRPAVAAHGCHGCRVGHVWEHPTAVMCVDFQKQYSYNLWC
jgi:hypothetical protein